MTPLTASFTRRAMALPREPKTGVGNVRRTHNGDKAVSHTAFLLAEAQGEAHARALCLYGSAPEWPMGPARASPRPVLKVERDALLPATRLPEEHAR